MLLTKNFLQNKHIFFEYANNFLRLGATASKFHQILRYSDSNAALYCLFFKDSLSFAPYIICKANFLRIDRFSGAFPLLALHVSSLKVTSKCQCS